MMEDVETLAGPSAVTADDHHQTSTAPAPSTTTVKHGYFSQPSNRHASRLLASPQWREANTATSESFLSGYFAKSRLHHLSSWKAQMQDMVGQALRDEARGRERGSPDLPTGTPRVIMHIDFDSFFVTVGLRKRPDLRGKPVVVCHSAGIMNSTSDSNDSNGQHQSSTSEIASCSYEARAFGVRNGMSLGQARKYCPQVQAIPYAFQEYHETSIQLYTLLLTHADAIEAVSVDEALIDVSLLLQSIQKGEADLVLSSRFNDHLAPKAEDAPTGDNVTPPTALAQALREEIYNRTGCSASIGIGANVLLARLATRKAKPGGAFHLENDAVQDFTAPLDIDDLWGVGWHTREELRSRFGTIKIGELRPKLTESKLKAILGPKQGSKMYKSLNGIDRNRLEPQKLRQSVGANVNYAIRFQSQDEAREFVHKLSIEVVSRLKAARLKGRQVAVNVMVRAPDAPAEAPKFMGHGVCDVHHRSMPLAGPGGSAVDSLDLIEPKAWSLISGLNADPKELRGIGISLHKLELAAPDGGPSTARPEKGQQALNFGATKRNRDELAALSMSQIDPTMLEELPDWIRAEVMQGVGPSRSRAGDGTEIGPTKAGGNPSEGSAGPSVICETPTKRARVQGPSLDSFVRSAHSTPDKQATGSKITAVKATTPFSTPQRSGKAASTIDAVGRSGSSQGVGGSSSSSNSHHRRQVPLNFTPNPDQMTDDEIRALSIDPTFLRALPVAIQRELIAEHTGGGRVRPGAIGAAIGTSALFKAGQQSKSLSKAEARRDAARKAAILAQPGASKSADRLEGTDVRLLVVAKPARSTSPSSSIQGEEAQASTRPSLTTRDGQSVSSPEGIRSLVSQWFERRSSQAPRESEVSRISKYVLACVTGDARIGSDQWDVESAWATLRWWRHLMQEKWPECSVNDTEDTMVAQQEEAGSQLVAMAWWDKWRDLRRQVVQCVSERVNQQVRM
ncbi:deoxycytidyl transferase [Tilletia horrida]|uniref:DNA repair protein REV1 n=1 Tax=Tilletia horrida TaxID=155126 RepID=A0AAN6JYX9_9BASI|nr:deoxycytidyl transferase [Tilletia horrida]KAK0566350.1 deoxycytidyl transferase [Tilletia horrida]